MEIPSTPGEEKDDDQDLVFQEQMAQEFHRIFTLHSNDTEFRRGFDAVLKKISSTPIEGTNTVCVETTSTTKASEIASDSALSGETSLKNGHGSDDDARNYRRDAPALPEPESKSLRLSGKPDLDCEPNFNGSDQNDKKCFSPAADRGADALRSRLSVPDTKEQSSEREKVKKEKLEKSRRHSKDCSGREPSKDKSKRERERKSDSCSGSERHKDKSRKEPNRKSEDDSGRNKDKSKKKEGEKKPPSKLDPGLERILKEYGASVFEKKETERKKSEAKEQKKERKEKREENISEEEKKLNAEKRKRYEEESKRRAEEKKRILLEKLKGKMESKKESEEKRKEEEVKKRVEEKLKAKKRETEEERAKRKKEERRRRHHHRHDHHHHHSHKSRSGSIKALDINEINDKRKDHKRHKSDEHRRRDRDDRHDRHRRQKTTSSVPPPQFDLTGATSYSFLAPGSDEQKRLLELLKKKTEEIRAQENDKDEPSEGNAELAPAQRPIVATPLPPVISAQIRVIAAPSVETSSASTEWSSVDIVQAKSRNAASAAAPVPAVEAASSVSAAVEGSSATAASSAAAVSSTSAASSATAEKSKISCGDPVFKPAASDPSGMEVTAQTSSQIAEPFSTNGAKILEESEEMSTLNRFKDDPNFTQTLSPEKIYTVDASSKAESTVEAFESKTLPPILKTFSRKSVKLALTTTDSTAPIKSSRVARMTE